MLTKEIMNQSSHERLSVIKNIADKSKILVHEIYSSIQGESSHMGIPCTFIRTAGCHLRCSYCDTAHAFFNGNEMSIEQIMARVKGMGNKMVELTGGEPLLQQASITLLEHLVNGGFTVLMETSGAVSIKKVPKEVKVILDIKTPSSKEANKNVYDNLNFLWPGCEVKFVISDGKDYQFAKGICDKYKLYERTHVLFSPVVASLDPKSLAQWVLEDRLNVRFQMQLHRMLYGEQTGV